MFPHLLSAAEASSIPLRLRHQKSPNRRGNPLHSDLLETPMVPGDLLEAFPNQSGLLLKAPAVAKRQWHEEGAVTDAAAGGVFRNLDVVITRHCSSEICN